MSVPALCAACPSKKIKDLAEGCSILRVPADNGLSHSRRVVHLATPALLGNYVPFAHHDCVHNQLVAIHNRVCGVVPRPTPEGLSMMRAGARIISKSLPRTVQEELGAFAEKYGGQKRARYMQAVEHVLENGLSRRNAGVTMFIKCEKMDPVKCNPDPRAIQFRDPKYCVLLASFLKPIEEHLYRLKIRHPLVGTTRLVGKGLNQVDRARLLRRKMERFRAPVVLSLDMSRFDQHVDVEALKIEHSVYLSSNPSSWFQRLLSWQLVNRVHSRLGFKYVTLGKRMSGDMNTALGNCVIMISMVLGIMIKYSKPFDLLDDGDDCLLIVERSELEFLRADLPCQFLKMGHELKIENVAFTLPQVSWCQSSPICTAAGWKFVRHPNKVMSCALVGVRWLNAPTWLRLEYLAGLADCEFVLNVGVPILQEYALALRRNSRGAKARFDESSGEWFRYLREVKLYRRSTGQDLDLEITDAARDSFYEAFGVSRQAQLDAEMALRNWNFSVEGVTEAFASWDPETWVNLRETFAEFQ